MIDQKRLFFYFCVGQHNLVKAQVCTYTQPKHTARKYGIFRGVLSNFLPLFSHQHATFPRFINHVRTGTQCVLRIYICSASVKMLGGNYYTAGYSSIFFLQLKVSKFQKQIFLFSFEPKKERNCFLMPQPLKMGRIKKMKTHILIRGRNQKIISFFGSNENKKICY